MDMPNCVFAYNISNARLRGDMDLARLMWNAVFRKTRGKDIVYDLWLEKYLCYFSLSEPILDVGCGSGNNTKYLHERGYRVIASDFSSSAIKNIKQAFPEIPTLLHDMRESFPYTDRWFGAIVADLSLHYFSWDITKKIINEIQRVLMPNRPLLLRVNSISDINYGARKGKEIETHYYLNRGIKKRYFDVDDINALFCTGWKRINITETTMTRYQYPKMAWELCLLKE